VQALPDTPFVKNYKLVTPKYVQIGTQVPIRATVSEAPLNVTYVDVSIYGHSGCFLGDLDESDQVEETTATTMSVETGIVLGEPKYLSCASLGSVGLSVAHSSANSYNGALTTGSSYVVELDGMLINVIGLTGCGNGTKDSDEACDDLNILDGDGCSSTCTIEAGYTCTTIESDLMLDGIGSAGLMSSCVSSRRALALAAEGQWAEDSL